MDDDKTTTGNQRRIRLLPPEEARKIAAGEVIDRPAALVREFIDNSIDAGSGLIEVLIEDGGSRRVEVIDDGRGMVREDLELCWKTHATSKIRSVDDLATSDTLGFRGEALAAAAVVSHLEILTSTDGREAWCLEVGPGNRMDPSIEQSRRAKGTSVRAIGIFDTIPVRKRFLKRDWSESGHCKQAFTEKAMAFPNIGFRFTQDGKLKTFLSPAPSFKERFAAFMPERNETTFLHEIRAAGQGYSVTIVVGGPEVSRNDRKWQYIFANGRKIEDYSLRQALEYGVQGWFPNAMHPVGAIFLDIDPGLADFNIHPAKREVRFSDVGAIHHTITQALLDFAHHLNRSMSFSTQSFPRSAFDIFKERNEKQRAKMMNFPDLEPLPIRPQSHGGSLALEALLESQDNKLSGTGDVSATEMWGGEAMDILGTMGEEVAANPMGEKSTLRYAGTAFGVFIIVEKEQELFLIDQHAAHERILYEKFLAKDIPVQELLVAIPFTTESEEEDRFIAKRREELARLGVIIVSDSGSWRIEALPIAWRLGDMETVREILNLRNAGENIVEHWAATLSCHAAIKEGSYLDENTALALAEATFALPALPIPRCPHGRPIWFRMSQEDLFKAVKRSFRPLQPAVG